MFHFIVLIHKVQGQLTKMTIEKIKDNTLIYCEWITEQHIQITSIISVWCKGGVLEGLATV